MSAKIKYTDEPLGEVQVAPDFLPSPAELAFREEGMKVPLPLSKASAETKIFTEERRCRLTREALVDVDAGSVVDHRVVQAWTNSLDTESPLPVSR